MKRAVLLLAFVAASALSTGCLQLGITLFGAGCAESPRYRSVSRDEVWHALQRVVNDFYDIRLADDDEYYLESEWSEHLGPMYRMGRRLRVRAYVKEDEELGGLPYFEVTVDRQVNTNMERPLSSVEADWETDWDVDGRDQSREHRLIMHVNMLLKEIKPSREILENKPSEYSLTPEAKQRRELWGQGERESPPADDDLWK